MKKIHLLLTSITAFNIWITTTFNAFADTVYEGMAKPWQINFQPPATPVMEKLYNMHQFLLVIITAITIFVFIVMAYIMIRFRRKANPVPSKTTHNTKLEIIWTTIPILILVVIAIPSLRIHYYMENVVNPELTVKVVGNQWYWHYDYPDAGGFGFDSYIKKGADLKPGDIRQLSVDNDMVVPVDTTVRILLTGADVIHSWAVPAFGVKRDAVPGRLNETWFKATKIGRFYGQCSQLCGVGHGFMPIVVDVVSKDDFKAWAQKKKEEANPPQATETKALEPVAAADKKASKDSKPADSKAKKEPAKKEEPADKADTDKAKKADKDDSSDIDDDQSDSDKDKSSDKDKEE